MDGTETGWGRPAEPAPRWRALLDRALLGSRTGEQPVVRKGEDPDDDDRPGGPRNRDLGDGGDRRNGDGRNSDGRNGDGRNGDERPVEIRSVSGPPLPSRPVNPLDRRSRNPLDPRSHPGEVRPGPPRPGDPGEPAFGDPRLPGLGERLDARPVNPLDRRPVNPLDRRGGSRDPRGGPDQRPPGSTEPRPTSLDPRPVNPLDPRRPSRLGDGLHGRGEAAEQHSFFSPATRSVPPPISRINPDTGYPPARAAASVGSAAVLPPPPPAPPAPAPPAPAPAPAAPPAVPQAAPTSPTSPAPARIEWRQARPEADLERAVAVLRRKLGRPRVLAFANPKGGVHKTTATVLAAATIGSVRGRGVLAWDDNELRGTLGLRAGSARHARTIRHLVSDLMQIENLHGDDLVHRLDDYLRHASDSSYDVLAGEENPRFAQRLDQHTVRRVMDLLRRTHEVICVDTGNNVESANWQTVMQAADQLVLTSVPREDAAFTADWMLDLLHEIGMADLATNAVTLLSCPTPGHLPLLDDLSKHFATRTRAVAVVPYDPALEVGSSIEYGVLQPETRQAWLRAAAVMVEPFAE
ncbi:MAG TPA: ATPase [Actinoplanes sp.]